MQTLQLSSKLDIVSGILPECQTFPDFHKNMQLILEIFPALLPRKRGFKASAPTTTGTYHVVVVQLTK